MLREWKELSALIQRAYRVAGLKRKKALKANTDKNSDNLNYVLYIGKSDLSDAAYMCVCVFNA